MTPPDVRRPRRPAPPRWLDEPELTVTLAEVRALIPREAAQARTGPARVAPGRSAGAAPLFAREATP